MTHPSSSLFSLHVTGVALGFALSAVLPAHAQQPATGASTPEQLSATCAGCHGPKGEGMAASNFPRIAGQSPGYLAKQLASYADGSRPNPIMGPIAKGLTREQIEALSQYYAGLEAPAAKGPAAGNAGKRASQLASVGDNALGVQGCANCHGPGGSGEPPNMPYLASQHSGYLSATLADFKKGARKTDPSGMMNQIASRLSDADIKAVSGFYAAQAAPPPAAGRLNVAGRRTTPSVTPAGPPGGAASVPVQGIGVEQGAPTTGGGQGPGGGGGTSGTGPQGTPSK